jgi:hypothetical protein
MNQKNKKWYATKRFWGGALTLISTGLELFAPPHTFAYKAGLFIGVGLSTFGFIDKNSDYKISETIKEKMPSGLSEKNKSK